MSCEFAWIFEYLQAFCSPNFCNHVISAPDWLVPVLPLYMIGCSSSYICLHLNIYSSSYLCIWVTGPPLTSTFDWLVLLLTLHLISWSSPYLCIWVAGPPLTSTLDWLVLLLTLHLIGCSPLTNASDWLFPLLPLYTIGCSSSYLCI